MVDIHADVPNACRNSANVRSGCSVIKAANRGRSGVKIGVRHRVCVRGAIEPVSRRRCWSRWTQARLTEYFAATSSARMPASQSRMTRVRKSIEYGAIGTSL